MAAYLCSNVPEFIKLENWPPSSSETPPSVWQASPQPTQTLMDVKHWERSECTLHTGHSWTWNIEKDLSALNILDTHGPETLRKIWVHSTYWTLMDVKHWEKSECTQHTGQSWTWNIEKDLSALNILDTHGRETLRKIWVHSTYWTLMDVKHWERSQCTQHIGHSWTWNTEKDLSALNILDTHGRETLRKISVHSTSACTRHGDELRIANNGNKPWKRLCSMMGPALNDNDDE